jgi:two-component system OmpR family response regulator
MAVRRVLLRNQDISRESGPTERILVVDHDPAMRCMIVNYFQDHRFRVVSTSGRQQMIRLLSVGGPSLVILDLCGGRENGFDLLREILTRSDVPVIVTTGPQSNEIDGVLGLELGADDHLAKPFGLHELAARIRAVLRRRKMRGAACQRDRKRSRRRFGGWQLDQHAGRLTDPNDVPVALTKGEYSLLVAFLDAPQRPLSREHLLQACMVSEDVFYRSIDVQIFRLRRKLESDPSAPRVIRTERGFGYVFALPVEPPVP